MRLLHLGLPVSDVPRSLAFYADHFGFDAANARRYPDGTVIVGNADGFDLALHPSDEDARSGFFHFGFQLAGPDEVREALARLRAADVPVVESDDEPGYVAFKCLDPDGWRIEVYWEPVASG